MIIELGLQVIILVTEYASFEERAVIKCYAMQHVQYVVNTNSKTCKGIVQASLASSTISKATEPKNAQERDK